MVIFIMNPEPSCKVWLVRIELTFRSVHNVVRHIPDSGVLDTVTSSVFREEEVLDLLAVYAIV